MGQGEGKGRQGPTTVLCLAESTGRCQAEGQDEGLEAQVTSYIKHLISWKPFNWSLLLNAIMDSLIFSRKQT